MIDTHCHIYSEYYENLDEIIDKLKNSDIKAVIVNGCDMKSNKEILNLVKKYDIIYGALGFHPTELNDVTEEELQWLEQHINDDKIVAVGEIGLDYHYDDTDKEKQLYFFKKQLEIAKRNNKPVIIHTRDSLQDTYNIVKKSKCKGSIHCYSGSLEMAKEFIKVGFCIGIGGIVTFKNAKNIIEVIKNIDEEYILLETDSPYLTPEPYRKYKNDSSYLNIILEKICSIRSQNYDYLKRVTTSNAVREFDFKKKL